MLVTSRKVNETIVIKSGEHVITVMVTKLECGKASIGIDAPKDVKILRGELHEREAVA